MTDTIFAPATAPGRGAVAVVRLSGPASAQALERLSGPLPAPRRATLRRLWDPDGGGALDDALVLWMPGPGSYTGEDSAELQVHGGLAVVEAVTGALASLGLRLAEPGEFTRRAFENGKLDLTQAEAVADLVDAETTAQREQALRQLGGALSGRYAAWRGQLVEALAYLEAAVDFPDEDLPATLAAQVGPRLAVLAASLEAALADGARGERIRDGFRIALVGAPNAGKSSLLNRLAGRDMAIVTPTPGTTRDVIEASLTLEGFRVVIADTAGLRDSEDDIEVEGVRRARAWAAGADLRLWVVDGSLAVAPADGAELLGPGDLAVLTKSDLPAGAARAQVVARVAQVVEADSVSAAGLERLRTELRDVLRARLGGGEFPAATQLRHRLRLESALVHLRRAQGAADPELAAEDLRLSARALAEITGRVDAEQVLDVVFSSFCIGK